MRKVTSSITLASLALLVISLMAGCAAGLKHDVVAAKTPSEEAMAFKRVNELTLEYKVILFAEDGSKIPMNLEKDRQKAATVKIEWPDGTAASRRLLDYKNLEILMRE